jgi:hypothetical protein
MRRIVLASFAAGLILLGLWLIARPSLDASPQTAGVPQVRSGDQQANPVALGVATLAGGGLLGWLVFRRS